MVYLPRQDKYIASDPGRIDDAPNEDLVRVEFLILGPSLPEVRPDEDKENPKTKSFDALMCAIRRILRPKPGLSVRADGESVRIVVGDEKIDLGPEILRWYTNSLRTGRPEPGLFEVSLPRDWLRPMVAERAVPTGAVSL